MTSTLKDVYVHLEKATHPVAKALHKGENFRTLVIGFKKGMVMKEHKVVATTKFTVFSGTILYYEKDKTIQLDALDEINIPIDVIHSVEAAEDALCLLTQG